MMPPPVLRFLLSTASSSPPPAKYTSADPPSSFAPVEPDYVIIIAALLCGVICIIGLISVARCAWLRRTGGSTGGQSSAAANKGFKKKVLRSLPKFKFDPASSSTEAASECAICLAEYTRGDEIKVLPQCRHVFHVHCIDTWLGSHSSCPTCRQILQTGRCRRCGEFSGNSNAGTQIQGRNCLT